MDQTKQTGSKTNGFPSLNTPLDSHWMSEPLMLDHISQNHYDGMEHMLHRSDPVIRSDIMKGVLVR